MVREDDVFDRTGTFHTLDGYSVLQSIPTMKNFDFQELCEARAQELVSRGKHIKLMWSGGADGSLVLALLERSGMSADQLSVICNSCAFSINPLLAEHIADKYPVIVAAGFEEGLTECVSDDSLILTGIGADMLTAGFEKKGYPDFTLDELVAEWIKDSEFTAQDYQDLFAKLSQAADEPCETVAQYSFLKNLVLCWQSELLNVGRHTGKGQYGTHFENFFCTEDFQSWSLYHDADSVWGLDEWGNKKVVADILNDVQPGYLPRTGKQGRFSTWQLYSRQHVLEIRDDWGYVTV